MTVPSFVSQLRSHVLCHSLGEPRRNDGAGDGHGNESIGEPTEDILSAFVLIPQILKRDCRYAPRKFHRGLDLNVMRELMRDHIAKPVMCTAEIEVEGVRPDDDRVRVIICLAVGIIGEIFDNERHLLIGVMMIERCDGLIHILGDLRRQAGGPLRSGMIDDAKMWCFDLRPIQIGARIVELSVRRRGSDQEREEKWETWQIHA